jgi:hypothetical protein
MRITNRYAHDDVIDQYLCRPRQEQYEKNTQQTQQDLDPDLEPERPCKVQ